MLGAYLWGKDFNVRKTRRFKYFKGLNLGILIIGALFATGTPAHATPTVFLSESFKNGSSAPNLWLHGGIACLTAGDNATPGTSIPSCQSTATDASGSGALRLTDRQNNQSGFVIYNQAIPSNKGLSIEFDQYQYSCNLGVGYDGTTSPKQCYDGIAFFLIDGSKSPTAASTVDGGSLGYAGGVCDQKSTAGIEGGFMGLGFDMYGNYSCENTTLFSHLNNRPLNSLAIRGSQSTMYSLVTPAKVASAALDNQTATDRTAAKRRVLVTMSEQSIMNVWIDYGNGPVQEYTDVNLKTLNGQQNFPATFKLGFSAGTGASFIGGPEIHEIQNLSIQSLDPDITVAKDTIGEFVKGQNGRYQITVSNKPNAGTVTGPLTMTDTLPTGVTFISASGGGWACNESSGTVTCTSNALLSAGESAPPITLDVAISKEAPGDSITNTARASTPDDADDTNDSTSRTVSFTTTPGVPNAGRKASNLLLALGIPLLLGFVSLLVKLRRSQRTTS